MLNAFPVEIETLPELPVLDVPVFSTTAPLVATLPELAVCKDNEPVFPSELAPEEITIWPP